MPDGLNGVKAISANYDYTVALKEDAAAVEWVEWGEGVVFMPRISKVVSFGYKSI